VNKKIDLIYKLDGPLIDEGIDVFELSPLLLSLGELIQESNSTLHPSGDKLSVNVKPFERGSFVMELQLFAQTNAQQLLHMVNQDSVRQIKELLEWMGIISGGTVGVIKVYKFLKGPPKRVEVGPEDVKIIAQDDNSITINKKTYALFQNTKIQQNIYRIYGNFLGKDGIESVKSYLKENERETKVEVEKSDVPYFNPANTIPVEQENLNENKTITISYLKPKRISLEGEADNWSFRKGEDAVIVATIKDPEFLGKIVSAEIRLSHEDLLEVRLLEIQTINNNELSVKYEIQEVIKYTPAPIQQSLI